MITFCPIMPALRGRIDPDLRAGIDTSRYPFLRPQPANPTRCCSSAVFDILPIRKRSNGSRATCLPRVLARKPEARLVVVGSDPPPRHSLPYLPDAVELRGFVEDVLEPLARYAVFVCPILSGSGVRVKLLEAFAAGIPVVSTSIGAEGLASVGRRDMRDRR